VEVLAGDQAAGLEDGAHDLVGRPGVCRRLEDHRLARDRSLGDRGGGRLDRPEVRAAVLGEREWARR
jgi:hypothetical protein